MGTKTIIGSKGVRTQKNNEESSIFFENKFNAADSIRYEYHQHSAGVQTFSDATGSQLFIDGTTESTSEGSETWNIATSVWTPKTSSGVYNIDLETQMDSIAGSPVINFDFVLSGTTLVESSDFKYTKTAEHIIRSTQNISHFSRTYTIIADGEWFASGGIFICSTDGTSINVVSASIAIKEG